MIQLDFSKNRFDRLNPDSPWQLSIHNFIKEWNSETDFVLARTSGSTGVPKEIRLPKKGMKLSAQLTGEFFGLKNGDTALLCMPVNFIAGKMMVVRAAELGLNLYCIEPTTKIDFSRFQTLDFVPLTPMQLENSFDSIGSVKTLLIGGAPLSDSLRNRLLNKNTNAFESYGMTETITHIGLKKISEEFFTVLNRVKIRKDKRECLVIQTPYFDEEVVTNDLVKIKNQNQFKWLGRFDNVINSGGIKLIPEQIEEKLKTHIQQDFIISSLPDDLLGEKLILIIEDPGMNQTQPTIVKGLENQLPFSVLGKYEVPKEMYFVKEFQRTESGKIKRKEITG